MASVSTHTACNYIVLIKLVSKFLLKAFDILILPSDFMTPAPSAFEQILKRGCGVNDRDGLTDMSLLHYCCKAGAQGIGQYVRGMLSCPLPNTLIAVSLLCC